MSDGDLIKALFGQFNTDDLKQARDLAVGLEATALLRESQYDEERDICLGEKNYNYGDLAEKRIAARLARDAAEAAYEHYCVVMATVRDKEAREKQKVEGR